MGFRNGNPMKNQNHLSWMTVFTMIVAIVMIIILPLSCSKKRGDQSRQSASTPVVEETTVADANESLNASYQPVVQSAEASQDVGTNDSDMSPEMVAFMKEYGMAGFARVEMSLDTDSVNRSSRR